jgi:branched-chain amino acid transport system ATP-binding protein
MLLAQDIHKHFGGVTALSGASLTVAQNSITGLIGPNGAGKSTLFAVLSSFVSPDQGKVMLFDEDITHTSAHLLVHKGIVRTFQVPREFRELTVLENLMTAPLNQEGEKLTDIFFRSRVVRKREEAIRQTAKDILAFLKIDHLTNELAKNLSGGQKKLLELGRALMTEPRLLLLDEPFAGVNPVLIEQIMDRLQELRNRGLTLFIIEHNIQAISELSDTLYVMAEGKILTHGSPQIVIKDPVVLEAYLGGEA